MIRPAPRFRAIPLCLVALALTTVGCAELSGERQPEPKTPSAAPSIRPEFNAAAVTTLDIRCGMGPVKIVGDDEIKALASEALIYIHRSGARASIQFNTWDLENPKLVLPDPKPTGGTSLTGDATFRIPPTAKLVVFNEGGNLEISGMTKTTKVLNLGDDVQLHDLKGIVELTTSGKIGELRGVRGQVQLQDAEGDFTISEVTGNVTVNDRGGNLSVFTVTGDVIASNATTTPADDYPGRPVFRNIDGNVTLVRIAAELSEVNGLTGQIKHQSQ